MSEFVTIVLAGGDSDHNLNKDELTLECLKNFQSKTQNILALPIKDSIRLKEDILNLENSSLVEISSPTKGALASAALCMENVNEAYPILIVPNNVLVPRKYVTEFVDKMKSGGYKGGCLTIKSSDERFSYAALDTDGNIVQIIEKQVVGENALAGIYYFCNRETFLRCAVWSFRNQVTTNSQFYIAPSLNYLLSRGETVGLHNLPLNQYFRFDSQFDAKLFTEWKGLNEKL